MRDRRRERPVCSQNCGQIVIDNEGGTIIINVNCCTDVDAAGDD
jgi:hypothetical protein